MCWLIQKEFFSIITCHPLKVWGGVCICRVNIVSCLLTLPRLGLFRALAKSRETLNGAGSPPPFPHSEARDMWHLSASEYGLSPHSMFLRVCVSVCLVVCALSHCVQAERLGWIYPKTRHLPAGFCRSVDMFFELRDGKPPWNFVKIMSSSCNSQLCSQTLVSLFIDNLFFVHNFEIYVQKQEQTMWLDRGSLNEFTGWIKTTIFVQLLKQIPLRQISCTKTQTHPTLELKGSWTLIISE